VSEALARPRVADVEEPLLALDPCVSPIESNERYTPNDVLLVVKQLGVIAFDPATPAHNPTGALRFVAPPNDGLQASWVGCAQGGLIFCNPPYSRGQIAKWVRKAIIERRRGAEVLLLLPQDLGTVWGQMLVPAAQGLCFWKGRINYVRPDGAYDAGAKQPSLFAYLGRRTWAFHDAFAARGCVLTRGAWG
jgi:hypothetical protein